MSAANLPMKKNQNTKGAFGHRRFNKPIPMVSPTEAFEIPEDVKTDIATVVSSVPWIRQDASIGGRCSSLTATGLVVLTELGLLPVTARLGGMVYRAGPDERKDLVAFCGDNNNMGCVIDGHFMGHIYLISATDLIDFSVGDWRNTDDRLRDYQKNDPIEWTAPTLPKFFWDDRSKFAVQVNRSAPQLGRAWYTLFDGTPPTPFREVIMKRVRKLEPLRPKLAETLKMYGLKERLRAVLSPVTHPFAFQDYEF
jgi:hypothetical protein